MCEVAYIYDDSAISGTDTSKTQSRELGRSLDSQDQRSLVRVELR